MEDREMKKMRMYEEMFQKKAQEEERKRKLKEKREFRRQSHQDGMSRAVSMTGSPGKDMDIDVISEAN